jgi:twitching motility protein PilT
MKQDPVQKIIQVAIKRGASDLHIKAGDVFRARIDGKLVPLTKQRLTPDQTRAIALMLIPHEEDRRRIDHLKDYDCSWGMPGVGRFRVNLLRQRSSFMIVMRVIPFAVPSLESLGVPEVLATLVERPHGFIAISGASGSGRSSTMAAMIHHLNSTVEKHIVSIENPIEFLHRDLKSSITQRDVGIDTGSVYAGLQSAVRQDPDVIVIGELRDGDTAETAIKAAEMGHLVIGVFSTPNVPSTLSRLLAMFPSEDRDMARTRLADVLLGVSAQQLVPRKTGDGRVAVFEVLVATDAVRDWLRTHGTLLELQELMTADDEESGMCTFDSEIARLVDEEIITAQTAEALSAQQQAPPKKSSRRAKSSSRKSS